MEVAGYELERSRRIQAWFTDLVRYITLDSKGPDVRFESRGTTAGTGTYRGEWVKVVRHESGRPDITYWFAYVKDAQGVVHATWPGIVRVTGVPSRNPMTIDYIFSEWAPGRSESARRYPRKIEGYTVEPARTALRFAFVLVDDFRTY